MRDTPPPPYYAQAWTGAKQVMERARRTQARHASRPWQTGRPPCFWASAARPEKARRSEAACRWKRCLLGSGAWVAWMRQIRQYNSQTPAMLVSCRWDLSRGGKLTNGFALTLSPIGSICVTVSVQTATYTHPAADDVWLNCFLHRTPPQVCNKPGCQVEVALGRRSTANIYASTCKEPTQETQRFDGASLTAFVFSNYKGNILTSVAKASAPSFEVPNAVSASKLNGQFW